MTEILLIGLVLSLGLLTGIDKERRFDLAKAFFIVVAETLIGSALFVLFVVLLFQTSLYRWFAVSIESWFIIILLIAIIDGVIIYWLNRWLIPKLKISHQVQTLCEYIIQWALIYMTVYQVVFDNLINPNMLEDITGTGLAAIDIASPSELVILILPSLISVWIAIILDKVYKNKL